VIVLVKESENGRLVRFLRGQIFPGRLAGASVIESATSLGVSRATVSKVTSAYKNHGKNNISEEEQWAKINIDRKRT
jgi:hypothetical protein